MTAPTMASLARLQRSLAVLALVAAGCGGEWDDPPLVGAEPEVTTTFSDHIHPLFVARCGACHASTVAAEAFLGLVALGDPDVNVAYDAALSTLVPGEPERSPLWQRLTTSDLRTKMPTSDGDLPTEPFTEGELERVRRWILEGALKKRRYSYGEPAPSLPDSLRRHKSDSKRAPLT